MVAALVLVGIAWAIVDQWRSVEEHRLDARPRWGFVLLSGALFLATHAMLVETWRRTLMAWGQRISFIEGARVWTVSNLGRYVPGRILQIIMMARMAQQRSVSAIAATGSAVLSTVVSIASGIAIAMITGWSVLDALSGGHAIVGVALLVVAAAGLLLLPFVTPRLMAVAARVSGRPITLAALPARAIWLATAGNAVSWLTYGLAFQVLVIGVIGQAPGTVSHYIAAYASSYILGYLALVVPGGLGVRDGAMALALPALGLATTSQALLIAVASRLWLTVLEITPGLIFLAHDRLRRTTHPHDIADGST